MRRLLPYLAAPAILGALAFAAHLFWSGGSPPPTPDVDPLSFRRFHAALLVMSKISAERGPANSAMTEAAGDEPFTGALRTSRADVDDAIAILSTLLAGRDDRSRDCLAQLGVVREHLGRARRDVDAIIAQPRTERSAEGLQLAIEGMFSVIDPMQGLVGDLGDQIVAADPAAANMVQVATLITELRDVAGRLGSQFIVPLHTGQPPDAERVAEIGRLRTRVKQMHARITADVAAYLSDPDVARAWAVVNSRYFDHAMELVDGVLFLLEPPCAVGKPMTPAQFTARLMAEMTTLQALRDVIVSMRPERAADARDRSRHYVAALLRALASAPERQSL